MFNLGFVSSCSAVPRSRVCTAAETIYRVCEKAVQVGNLLGGGWICHATLRICSQQNNVGGGLGLPRYNVGVVLVISKDRSQICPQKHDAKDINDAEFNGHSVLSTRRTSNSEKNTHAGKRNQVGWGRGRPGGGSLLQQSFLSRGHQTRLVVGGIYYWACADALLVVFFAFLRSLCLSALPRNALPSAAFWPPE